MSLLAGQCATVVVEQGGDLALEWRDHANAVIVYVNDDYTTSGEERIEVVPDSAGPARIAVISRLRYAPATRFRITLQNVRPATDRDRRVATIWKLRTEGYLALFGRREVAGLTATERALTIAEQEFGPDDLLVALVARDIAELHSSRHNYPAAQPLYERARSILTEKAGADHPSTAYTEVRLAAAYVGVSDFARADPLLGRALQVLEKASGPESYVVGTTLLSIGLMLGDRRDYVGAIRSFERAETIIAKLIGTRNNVYSAVLNNLGLIYLRQREYDKARPYFERSLTIDEGALGPETLEIATRLQNLGIVAREQKDYPAAERYYARALAIKEKRLGLEHPELGGLLNNIANLYSSQGNYERSLQTHLRALAIMGKDATEWDQPTMSLGNIARTYAALGDFPNALAYQRRVDAALESELSVNLAIGSERQKLAYLAGISERTNRTVSLHLQLQPQNPDAAMLAAVTLMQRKARALDAMADTFGAMRQRASSEDQELMARLSETTARFARIVLNGPGNTPPEKHRQLLVELEQSKEKLEAEIGRHSDEFRAQSAPVSLAVVRAAIPGDAALIEFVVYRPFNPKSPSMNVAYGPARYAAYVLRRDGQTLGVDLGDAKTIDADIETFRA
jgi:tetratricopeptide (TPR) repeat protein